VKATVSPKSTKHLDFISQVLASKFFAASGKKFKLFLKIN